jgi:hypothetical protein
MVSRTPHAMTEMQALSAPVVNATQHSLGPLLPRCPAQPAAPAHAAALAVDFTDQLIKSNPEALGRFETKLGACKRRQTCLGICTDT